MSRVKKIKLEIDDEIEFPILGLSTALGDYRLAWELNSKLNLKFDLSEADRYKITLLPGAGPICAGSITTCEESIYRYA